MCVFWKRPLALPSFLIQKILPRKKRKYETAGRRAAPRVRERGERRVSEAREIIASGSGRNRFELGSIEPPYKGPNPFSGNPFLPVREKAIDSAGRRALRARGGGSKIQKPKTFWRKDFLEGNAIQNRSVLAPPSRARTSPFAGGSETSEAP